MPSRSRFISGGGAISRSRRCLAAVLPAVVLLAVAATDALRCCSVGFLAAPPILLASAFAPQRTNVQSHRRRAEQKKESSAWGCAVVVVVGSGLGGDLRQRRRISPTFTSSMTQLNSRSSHELPGNENYSSKGVEDASVALEAARDKWRRRDLFGQTLVTETLEDMNSRGPEPAVEEPPPIVLASSASSTTASAKITSKEERTKQRRDLHHLNVPSFSSVLATNGLALRRKSPTILQVNIGLYCNQACSHCHVESSPLRVEETMSAQVVERCLELLRETPSLTTLDITGGAPELNRNFRMLVALARQLRPDLEIIDRCNLTVLLEPDQEDLVDFLKAHKVRIVASLPCYSSENVDKQRGRGVFERSIAALLALNGAGYGTNPDLPLDLVYNPVGPFLPPDQSKLQVQYKDELRQNFGILFDSLFAITNMPIKRFADSLHRAQQLQSYMDLLVSTFNPEAVERVMCVDTVSVDYHGNLYDCDFNQQLGMPIMGGTKTGDGAGAGDHVEHDGSGKQGLTVFDVTNLEELSSRPIRTDRHCFGCTAGMGSSCQGATAAATAASAAEVSP